MSKASDERSTPMWLVAELAQTYGFTLDVCASEANHKCEAYYTIEMDGMSLPWSPHVCWMNPPY